MNHDNRDGPENFQNSLIECMGKAAFLLTDTCMKALVSQAVC